MMCNFVGPSRKLTFLMYRIVQVSSHLASWGSWRGRNHLMAIAFKTHQACKGASGFIPKGPVTALSEVYNQDLCTGKFPGTIWKETECSCYFQHHFQISSTPLPTPPCNCPAFCVQLLSPSFINCKFI